LIAELIAELTADKPISAPIGLVQLGLCY